MDPKNLIVFLLIGLAAGWVAGQVMRGQGFGVVGNMVLGVVGAVAGGVLFNLLQIRAVGTVGEFVTALVGALVLLFLARTLRKA